ncbi:DUF4249 family protein [Marivirga arenosa]|uniref:DUF4249 family protein n=1 Tax=Marivirga arenosa TaxID=3059076 RepID=A0AA49GDD0_9BACT|nr:DUF4249 family protein [Marivirga sp. BKB1-2]WKK79963.2 DUF4249 family protein [Marivirga sp. BKB1-2]
MKKIFLYTILYCLCISCIDPYEPDYSNIENENRIVVDAKLSNADTIYKIALSNTIDVGADTSANFIIANRVFILDDNGLEYSFVHKGQGIYELASSELCFELDNTYQLNIELEDGTQYSSTPVSLPEQVKFTEIKYRLQDKLIIVDEEEVYVQYIDFYGINNLQRNNSIFYQIGYEGFFALYPPYQGSSICWPACKWEEDQIPPDLSSLTFCYAPDVDYSPLNVIDLKPENNEIVVASLPTDFKFAREYSMNLIINSIDKSTFEYILAQKNQLDYGGGLFDPPPTNIIGNISNPQRREDYALGNFSIVNSYEIRVHVPAISNADYSFCDYSAEGICFEPPFDYCCDCRQYPGAITTRPEFFPAQ